MPDDRDWWTQHDAARAMLARRFVRSSTPRIKIWLRRRRLT